MFNREKNVFFPKLSSWLSRGFSKRPIDQSIIYWPVAPIPNGWHSSTGTRTASPIVVVERASSRGEKSVGRTVVRPKLRENEISAGRHERGRLPGGRENVHAGRSSTAALREAAESPGASAGLWDATGCRAPLGRGASHHAARRIFAAGLQKGLSRWALLCACFE